ncbi:hypothetical protein CC78DRAFT_568120 [Lojkania enalia]|uniref:Heterokaryon incompatibility domain-containing protein n=1 Tax=Lojkania enalia TaxID=147567 RepID=A0A9P4KA40_9PLEO|nr:hypothetical protein CC78DRAFT_568120 [Didymosphaeria enalia]
MHYQMRQAVVRFVPLPEPVQFHNVSLSKRQSCIGSGYLPCIDNLSTCCYYDQSCCGTGCCNTGYYCVESSDGPTCCPLSSDPSECGGQTTINTCPPNYSQCSNIPGCCPTGEECYYDSTYGAYCGFRGEFSFSTPVYTPVETPYSPIYTSEYSASTPTSEWYYSTTPDTSISYTTTHSASTSGNEFSVNSINTNRPSSSSFPKAAIGGIVGGVVFVAVLISVIVILCLRRKRTVPPPPPPPPPTDLIEFYHRYHSPINAPGYTRVLHLYGIPKEGNSSFPLHGRLEVIKIGEPMAVSYTAISYSWTRDDNLTISDRDCDLFCDIGQEGAKLAVFKLKPASAEILRALRSSTGLVLWVDQICIDQREKTEEFYEAPFENYEKKWQLERMGDIYKNAASTIIWLGVERDPNVSGKWPLMIAMNLVLSIAAAYETERKLDPWEPEENKYLLQLYSRNWFKRVWTFQEVMKSRGITVMLKSARGEILQQPWAVLGAAGMYIQRWGPYPTPIQFADHIEATTMKYLCWKAGWDRWPILTLLPMVRFFDVGYAKDKLYAIESCVHESQGVDTEEELARAEEPNRKIRLKVFALPYPKEHGWHIYHDLAITLIEQSQSLQILSSVQHLDSQLIQKARSENPDWDKVQPNPPLPSWVPNWYEKDISKSFSDSENAPYKDPTSDGFKACPYPHLGSEFLGRTERHILRVKGFVFGNIANCTDVFYGGTFDAAKTGNFENLGPNIWAWVTQWLGLNEQDLDENVEMTMEEINCQLEGTEFPNQAKLNTVRQVASFFTADRSFDGNRLINNLKDRDGTYSHEYAKFYGNKQVPTPWERAEEHLHDYMAFRSLWNPNCWPISRPHPQQNRIDRYAEAAASALVSRKIFQMDNGVLGIGPAVLDPLQGDVVCILQGAQVPFVLRPKGSCFELVGECYVHAYMDGEAVAGMGPLDAKWMHMDLI